MATKVNYTAPDFVNNSAPKLNGTNMANLATAAEVAGQILDAETDAGRAITQAATAAAQGALLGISNPDNKTLTVSANADTANIPTAAGKTVADTAGAATTANAKANAVSAVAKTTVPDGATAVYTSNFATTDGFVGTNATLSISATPDSLRVTSTSSAYSVRKTGLAIGGKVALIKIKASLIDNTGYIFFFRDSTSTIGTGYTIPLTTTNRVFVFLAPINATGIMVAKNSGASVEEYFELKIVWIGDYSMLDGSLLLEAAQRMNELAVTQGVASYATATITSSGTNISDGDTITIGGKVYTFKTTLTPTEGEVLIGTNAADSLANLVYATTEGSSGSNYGTKHYVATANVLAQVSHTASALTATITAVSVGLLGNKIIISTSATTLTLSNALLSSAATTLEGGIDAIGKKIIQQVQNLIAASGTRPAAAKIELTNTSYVGYETTVDVAASGTFTLPGGGTWIWNVYGYGATISSAKRGTSAGGTTLTVSGANASVGYRRIA